MQGVTTVVLGADGRGPLEVRQVLDSAQALGLGPNTYAMAGYGTARSRVMGASSSAATQAQIDSMRALIARAMAEGAYGVGSGLFYAPQSYASTDEVLAVVSAARKVDPGHPGVEAWLGRLAFEQGRLEDAIDALGAAVRADPDLHDVRLSLARALPRAGRLQAAREHVQVLLAHLRASDPRHADVQRLADTLR